MRFVWDPNKATVNAKKHGVSFEEAKTVFYDPHAFVVPDEWHSDTELCEIITGFSSKQRILVTVFVEREIDVVRIISARKATALERGKYEENARTAGKI